MQTCELTIQSIYNLVYQSLYTPLLYPYSLDLSSIATHFIISLAPHIWQIQIIIS